MTTTNFDTLNKAALREACRVRGINGYGKLDNDGMRAALKKHEARSVPKEREMKPEELPMQSAPVVTTPADDTGYTAPEGSNSPMTARRAVNAAVAEAVTKASAESPAAPAPAEKTTPTPKDQRNGVTRPKAGSLCAQVWDACDALKAVGNETSFEALKEKLPNHADATIRTQRQRWKTYHA